MCIGKHDDSNSLNEQLPDHDLFATANVDTLARLVTIHAAPLEIIDTV